MKCCGSKVIRQEEECCNGIGYNPERHVCADQPTPGLPIQVCIYTGIVVIRLCVGTFQFCSMTTVTNIHSFQLFQLCYCLCTQFNTNNLFRNYKLKIVMYFFNFSEKIVDDKFIDCPQNKNIYKLTPPQTKHNTIKVA